MMKFKLLLCLIAVLLLCSCGSSQSAKEFQEKSKDLIEKDEAIVLELFEMYKNHTIEWIGKTKVDDAILYNYDGTEYYIGVKDGVKDDSLDEKYERACEIYNYLINKYSVKDINYYENLSEFEIWFDESFIDTDYGIVYYTDFRTLDLKVENDDEEYFDELKDGFYFHVMFIGF